MATRTAGHPTTRTTIAAAGRLRPVVSGVTPRIDDGQVPIKRVVGDFVTVEADVFVDGHDLVAPFVRWRHRDDADWSSAPMTSLGNDRYRGDVPLDRIGSHELAVTATVDHFGSWRRDMGTKLAAGTATPVDLLVGAALLEDTARRCLGPARDTAQQAARNLRTLAAGAEAEIASNPATSNPAPVIPAAQALLGDERLAAVADAHPDLSSAATVPVGTVWVDRALAGSSAWYELFPRSASPDPARSGTLRDVIDRLPYVAAMGFDVLYLPPIHPIGTTARKGPNGATRSQPGDPGSPWAIGSPAGGHTAVHPDLGTIDDVDRLVAAAGEHGIEVALDLAWQCSPDHPWVSEHPDWFRRLPDGSIACAENPPKRYEDVYPLDFETADWRNLWAALADVVRFWIGHGIRVFRVDNPHTKPMRLWEWLLADIRADAPDVVFLAEAFTRPRVMEHLAKVGFSQSYTYFTWRTSKWDLETYLRELTSAPLVDYFRPNFWPNTPDILPEHLQGGIRAAFISRLVLAATATANYGIYGPAFELQHHVPRHSGSEEYLDSEKYEVRHWDLDDPTSLADLVALVNAARRAHPALRQDRTLRLVPVDNDQLIAYAKAVPLPATSGASGERTASGVPGQPGLTGATSEPGATCEPGATSATGEPGEPGEPSSTSEPSAPGEPGGAAGTGALDVIVAIVNLDPTNVQSGWVDLPLYELGLPADRPYAADDLLTGARYRWHGPRNYVALDPGTMPAHILHLHPDIEVGR